MKFLTIAILFLLPVFTFANSPAPKRGPNAVVDLSEFRERLDPGQIASVTSFSGDELRGHIIDYVSGGAAAPDNLILCTMHDREDTGGGDILTTKCFDLGHFAGEATNIRVSGSDKNFVIRFGTRVPNDDMSSSVRARVTVQLRLDDKFAVTSARKSTRVPRKN